MSRRRGNIRTWALLLLALVPTTAVLTGGLQMWADRGRDISRVEAAYAPIETTALIHQVVASMTRTQSVLHAASYLGADPEFARRADQDIAATASLLRTSAPRLSELFDELTDGTDDSQRLGLLSNIVDRFDPLAETFEAQNPSSGPDANLERIMSLTRVNAGGITLPHDRGSLAITSLYDNVAATIAYHQTFDHDRHLLLTRLAGAGDMVELDDLIDSERRETAWNQLISLRQLPVAGTAGITWPLTPVDAASPDLLDRTEPMAVLLSTARLGGPDGRDALLRQLLRLDATIADDITLTLDEIKLQSATEIAALQRDRVLTAVAAGIMSVVGLALLGLTLSEVRQRQRIERAHGEAIDQLADKADRDPTTGAWNRRHLESTLPGLLFDHEHDDASIVLAYIDLDSFKAINDVWGHHTGDRVLRIVTERLANFSLDEIDFELIRFGGDEFVIYAPVRGVGIEWLEHLGRSVLETLSNPMSIDSREHAVSASIGITMSDHESTLDSLLLEADSSLILAKRAKRGTAIVYNRQISRTGELVHALPGALAQNEIDCHLQPVFDVVTGRVCHAEALARWFRPTGESVSPSVFVPLVESFGLAEQLTANMLRSVAAIIASPTTPPDVRIWINLSPRELEVANFARRFADGLRKTGLQPERIGLEITETAAVRDPEALALELGKIRTTGVKIAIDDFGNGYSPLGFLRNLPVDTVKLDRSLISNIDTDAANQHIVRGIVGMLKELDIRITAEGVERVEEERWLARHGVDAIQGFLRGRPMPPTRFDWYAAMPTQTSLLQTDGATLPSPVQAPVAGA